MQESRSAVIVGADEAILQRMATGFADAEEGLAVSTDELPALRRLTVNPALAYRAIEFYLAHPDKRPELGNEASLRRLREGDFKPPQ